MYIERSIARVREFKKVMQWSTLRLAREAGMTESAIRKIDEPDWNPEAKTLRRLERVIPIDFHPDEDAAA